MMSDNPYEPSYPEYNSLNNTDTEKQPLPSEDAFFSDDFFNSLGSYPAASPADPVDSFPDPFAQDFGTPSAPRKSAEGNTDAAVFQPSAVHKKKHSLTLQEARTLLIVLIVTALLFCLPLIITVGTYVHQCHLVENGTSLEATVTKITARHKRSASGTAAYTYNGQRYEKGDLSVPKGSILNQTTITVYIDPDNPYDCCIKPSKGSFIWSVVGYAAGCVPLFIVVGVGIHLYRKKKRAGQNEH